jgi:hypothetical protein
MILFPAMFCDQKCMDEAICRYPDLKTSKSLAQCNHELFNGENCENLTFLRTVYECLVIAGSVDNLRALMQPKPGMTFHDFDLSDNESIGTKHLQILSILMQSQSVALEHYFKMIMPSTVLSDPFIKTFIKSEDDKNFIVKFATRQFQIRDKNAFSLSCRKDDHANGILPFGSFFNHSCDANVMRIQIDEKFAFVVLKPIKEDEQLFITYA